MEGMFEHGIPAAYGKYFLGFTLRYFILGGLLWGIFYVWWRVPLLRYKIQQRMPKRHAVRTEVRYSLLTGLLAAASGTLLFLLAEQGYTFIYTDMAAYGWGWFWLSIPVGLVLHDAYFYWMHRLSHWKPVYRTVHEVHHRSYNPTPWAAFSFHPLEAAWEVAILPLLAFTLPFHPLALLSVFMVSTLFNMLGHLGFEVFPARWVHHPVLKYLNTSTHHNLHHSKFRGNYSLYFNWWDRWCGTQFANYEAVFDNVKAQAAAGKRPTSASPAAVQGHPATEAP